MPWLTKGRTLVSDVTRQKYKVVSAKVGEGGFGEVYRGEHLDNHLDRCCDVAIKVSDNAISWHGEAYFGRLLGDEPKVVGLKDAFPLIDGSGPARMAKYVLVLEWIEDGTVSDALEASAKPWTENAIRKQLVGLLKVLSLLHRRGICHGDITPRNVFLRKRQLLLGDFGITKQSLKSKQFGLDGGTPDRYAPPDYWDFWGPSSDVYQVGLLALSLISGRDVASWEVSGRAIKQVPATDSFKGWLRDALSLGSDRFRDADEALHALRAEPIKPAPAPRTLRGQHVIFTGKLDLPRSAASAKAKRAGAIVQNRVNSQTSVVVAGQPNAVQIGQKAGTKLFDAHRRMRRGQRISIIDGKRFEKLISQG